MIFNFKGLLAVYVILYVAQHLNAFQIGYTYTYSYATSVDVTNRLAYKNNSYKDLSDNDLFSRSDEIIVDVVDLGGDALVGLRLKVSSDSNPVLVEYDTRIYSVKRVHYTSLDTVHALNFKRGIISLFNLDLGATGEVSKSSEDSSVLKIKKINKGINHSGQSFDDEYCQSDKAIDASLNRELELTAELHEESKLLRNVKSLERVDIFFELHKSSFRNVTARQNIAFLQRSESNLRAEINRSPERIVIGSDVFDRSSDSLIPSKLTKSQSRKPSKVTFEYVENHELNAYDVCNKEVEELGMQMKDFKKLKSGSGESCKRFLRLVKSLRGDSINEKILDKLGLKKYLKNERVGSFIVDAFVAAQTKGTLNALLKELQLNKLTEKLDKKEAKLLEKFLISSSFVTHTTLKDLYKVLEELMTLNSMYNINLKDLAGLTVGSIVQTASLANNSELVDQYYQLVKSELAKCKNDECRAYFLNSLSNAKLEKSVQDIFEHEIKNCTLGFNKNCILSLKAVRKMSSSRPLSKNLSDDLLKIFYNQSNSSDFSLLRLEALNLLLLNKEIREDSQMVHNILLTIYDAEDYQFTLFAQKLVFSYVQSSERMKTIMKSLISKFYHKQIQLNGASEVIRSDLLGSKNGHLSFDMKQLTGYPDNVMKSIDLSVNYENKITQRFLNILSFDVYTENLNTLLGSSGSKSQDPSAGLDLGILNKKIKKTEFFRGYTSLINAVWNAPTKLTTVFETNFLLNDQNEYIFLQNGLVLQLNTIGALSIDVSALAEISMWKQNANTLLQTNVALAIENSLKINDGKNEISFNYEFDTSVTNDFHLNANFQSDPLKLCMKLLLNKINLKQTAKNSIANKQVRTSIAIQPLTFMLSRKAINLC